MKRTFCVDGLLYELRVTRGYEIELAITGGALPSYQPDYDPFDWDYAPFVMDDIGTARYPVTVMRRTMRLLCEWIGEKRPSYFRFAARSDRRCNLYRRIALLLRNRFPDYQLVEHKGCFYFYRLKRSSTV